MPRGTASIEIDRPVEDVFAVLSDVGQTALWYPTVIEERWTSPEPHGVGSTRIAVSKSYGVRNENEAVVTVFDPNRALALESVRSQVPFTVSIRFAPTPSGARVDWEVEMVPTGLYKPVVSMTFGPFVRQLQAALGNLKAMMEAGQL